MKENWTYKKLGEVCDILNGFAFKSNEYIDRGIRVMRITNVQKGTIVDDAPQFFPLERMNEILKYMLQEGDLLMSLTGNVGRVGVISNEYLPAALNQRVACLRIKSTDILYSYLFHFLNSDMFENDCIFSATGIAQKNMSTKWLENYSIPVPPLANQSRIVSELDLLQSIIDKQKAQLKELDNLAQAVFYDMFGDPVENEKGWEVKKLGEICLLKAGKAIKASELSYNDAPSLFPCYGGNGVRGYINKYSHTESYPIVGRQGALCGNVNYAEAPFYATEHAVVVKPIKAIDTKWLFFQLKFMRLNQYAHGVAQPGLAVQDLEPLDCALPPLALQQSFAAKIESIEKQKAAITQSIAETQRLFDYTMDKYFG